MANRFNTYQQVDYVNLPLEAYQLAAGSKEAENMAKLSASKSSYDAMQAIEALANPDVQMKNSIMNSINEEIAGLANKNLKGADALMQLGRIVSDPSRIDNLTKIYGNTQNYRSKLEQDKAFAEEYGNDINTLPGTDEWERYNSQGIEGFKGGVLNGYTPGKYMDVIGDVQKAMNVMKADGWSEVPFSDGKWIRKGSTEEVSLERAMAVAGLQMNDPKFAKQLQYIAYAGLRPYGGNIDQGKAVLNYNAQVVQGTNKNIAKLAAELEALKKETDPKLKDKNAKAIEDGNRLMNSLIEKRNAYSKDTDGSLYRQEMITNLATIASAPSVFKKTTEDMIADPYGIMERRSALELSNWNKKYSRQRADQLEDRQTIMNMYEPMPTSYSAQVKSDGTMAPAVMFNAQGGYDPDALANTGMTILGNQTKGTNQIGDSKNITSEMRTAIAEELKAGTATISMIPATKEWSIISPSQGTIRVNLDHATEKAVDNLTRIADFRGKTNKETILNTVVSNGYNFIPAVVTKSKVKGVDGDIINFYTPKPNAKGTATSFTQAEIYNNPQLIGSRLDPERIYGLVYDGIYVYTERTSHEYKGNINTGIEESRLLPIEKYEELKRKGELISDEKVVYMNKTGDVITEVEKSDMDEFDFINNQVRQMSRKGGVFHNLSGSKLDKTIKVFESTKSSIQIGSGSSESTND